MKTAFEPRLWSFAPAVSVIVLLLTFSAARAAAPAANVGRPIVIGRSYAMHSAILGDQRRINVYLPDHYGDAGRQFSVLYLLDGGAREDFHHITGLAQINAAYGQGRELIVIGVEGVDRKHDLTSPSKDPADRKLLPTSGGSPAYRRFLVEELKPWVAARYKTDGHTAIMGESLAGLFVAETLLEAPSSFNDYISVSPSLWWNDGGLSTAAGAELRKARFAGVRAWIAFDDPAPAGKGAAEARRQQDALETAFTEAKPEGLSWTFARPGESHASIYHPAAMKALRALFGPPPPQ
jgi:predicted alpha/beta superfamily hydrolase